MLEIQFDRTIEYMTWLAIERVRAFAPADDKPYWLAYSGGKDSTVLLDIVKKSGVPFEAHYSLTSVDPPELVRFIRSTPGITIDRPEINMWQLIERKKFPPVRNIGGKSARWCCEELKEYGGVGYTVLTGVRWAESDRRKANRRLVEDRLRSERRVIVNPLIDWEDWHIWDYIRRHDLPCCSLYDEGFKRLGCIMCPQQGTAGMLRDAKRWPKYAAAYIRTFDRVIEIRKAAGKRCTWNTGQELFDWWVSRVAKRNKKQACFAFQ